jgi:glycosyltransferase involved in cell wall biosynthesis
MQRLLMLAPGRSAPGPVGRIAATLAGELRLLGHPVDLAEWGEEAADAALPRRLWSRAHQLRDVVRLVHRTAYGAVIVHTAHDARTLARDVPLLLAIHRAAPCVLEFHGSQPDRVVARRTAFARLSRVLGRLARGFLVLSQEERTAWCSALPDLPVHVVRNPYAATMGPRPARRPGPGPVRILFVGRVMRRKGLLDLVEACALLPADTYELRVVGAGEELAEVRALAGDRGVDLRLDGFLTGEDLAAAYLAADVFCLPTYWYEGLPTVLLEAMDAGLPIVTTRTRGAADVLVEEVHALFVPPRSPGALAAALRRLVESPALRTRLGEANRRLVAEFRPDLVAAEFSRTVAAVCGPTRDGPTGDGGAPTGATPPAGRRAARAPAAEERA